MTKANLIKIVIRSLRNFTMRVAYFGLSVILFLPTFDTAAQSRQTLEEQRKRTLLEIEETSRYLEETQQSQKESLRKLNLLNLQVIQYKKLISSIDVEIGYIDRQIGETSVKVTQMTAEIEKMKTEYAQLVFQTYKNRGKYNQLVYVLSAKDFNEAYRRMKYFQQYSEHRKKQVTEITAKQTELQVVIGQLTTQKTEKEKLLAEQRKENARLETVKTEQNKEVNSLKSQERKLRNQLIAQQQKAQKLQKEIEKMITAEAKKRNTTPANLYEKLTPEERLISDSFKGNMGRLPWPTEKGIITGFFGMNASPVKDVKLINEGIDITTVGGSEVRAVFDGEVTAIFPVPGENLTVCVRHGNYITVYTNLVDVTVKMGNKIKIKEKIGKVYTEKGAKTAVFKFLIWEGLNNKLNPELWLMKK